MMKSAVPYFLVLLLCLGNCFAGLHDADDGYLTEGEYGEDVWLEGNSQLIVMGGGADRITAEDYSYLEVRYTSTPLSNSSGIYDIMLHDYSELLYLDGITEEVTLKKDAVATLKGGRIDYITSYQLTATKHIDLYCQEGWSWISNNSLLGIQGLWQDGSSFYIEFINKDGYDPVWMNINIIPEPATLVLLGLGACAVMRKRK